MLISQIIRIFFLLPACFIILHPGLRPPDERAAYRDVIHFKSVAVFSNVPLLAVEAGCCLWLSFCEFPIDLAAMPPLPQHRKPKLARPPVSTEASPLLLIYITEVCAFYWTVLAPDIANPGREEQGLVSV